jgi:hypothetical protein
MRDIVGDLQARAKLLAEKISAENARFEKLVAEIKAKQDSNLEHLRAQLRLVNKLLEFTAWHDNMRSVLAARIAVAEAAEISIKKSFDLQAAASAVPEPSASAEA